MNWKTLRNWQDGSEEHYESEGNRGKISVVLQPKDQKMFDIFANGAGVYFKGWKK